MRSSLRIAGGICFALWAAVAPRAQGGNPIVSKPTPDPIVKRGLMVQVRDVARLPDTRGLRPLDQDVTPAARGHGCSFGGSCPFSSGSGACSDPRLPP